MIPQWSPRMKNLKTVQECRNTFKFQFCLRSFRLENHFSTINGFKSRIFLRLSFSKMNNSIINRIIFIRAAFKEVFSLVHDHIEWLLERLLYLSFEYVYIKLKLTYFICYCWRRLFTFRLKKWFSSKIELKLIKIQSSEFLLDGSENGIREMRHHDCFPRKAAGVDE